MKPKNYFAAPGCPVEATVDVIGGRWKGVILFHLIPGKKRFGEIRKILPQVTQRVLTQQLRELERDGVVHREVYAQVPPKVEYSLTALGKTLGPLILSMSAWGNQNAKKLQSARDRSHLVTP